MEFTSNDQYIWLENVNSEKSLDWVVKQNKNSDEYFFKNKYFENDKAEYEKVLLADDRLPHLVIEDGWFYNTWQDKNYKQGLFRRIKISDYIAKKENWEIVLDLDQQSEIDHKKWYLSKYRFLYHGDRILLGLSDGGLDAIYWKEFDLEKKRFVENGFSLPESKSDAQWFDQNTLIVADTLTSGAKTAAGYAKYARVWHRGEKVEDSKIIYSILEEDNGVRIENDQKSKNFIITHNISFTTVKSFLVKNLSELIQIQMTEDTQELSVFQDRLFSTNLKDWKLGTRLIKAGSLISWPIKDVSPAENNIILHFEPTEHEILDSYILTENFLCLNKLINIQTSTSCFEYSAGKFLEKEIDFPKEGVVLPSSFSSDSDLIVWNQSDFLQSPRLILNDLKKTDSKKQIIKTTSSKFNEKLFVKEQLWVVSKDGTKIPYFIVRAKDFKYDSSHPIWMTGYGGFELPMLPHYLSATGKIWLEQTNGVYILANIRGGGEFGPSWHQSAILENKQKSYDDFIAVAEDLIKRNITAKNKISINGGSNGGLLVAAVAMQRPELFKAVICQVPLLDMLRYNKLLAGASWMAEYGNPDIPEQKIFIEKYSPYQNLKPNVKYPDFYIYTSTKDDRVHPGHARKMAAKMLEYNQSLIYFEDLDGGHSRSTALSKAAVLYAKFTSFVKEKLLDQ